MRKVLIVSVILALLFSLTASAQNGEGLKKLEPLPRDLEIQLALSALPPHLRDNATVYVLNPDKGFEVARKGTNGFHALVARTGDDTGQLLALILGSHVTPDQRGTHDLIVFIERDRAMHLTGETYARQIISA